MNSGPDNFNDHKLLRACKALFLLTIIFVSAKFIAAPIGDYLGDQDFQRYEKVFADNKLI